MEYIHEELRTLARPIEVLEEDPNNVRLHDKTSLKSVRSSLKRFGQRVPVVIRSIPDSDKFVVIAGNARLLAARKLGWKHLACVSADADDENTALLYSLVDNKTQSMSEFDMAGLSEVLTSLNGKVSLDGFGWDNNELNSLLNIDTSIIDVPLDPVPVIEDFSPEENPTSTPSPSQSESLEVENPAKFFSMTFSVEESQHDLIVRALKEAKAECGGKSHLNNDEDGNCLAHIAKIFIGEV